MVDRDACWRHYDESVVGFFIIDDTPALLDRLPRVVSVPFGVEVGKMVVAFLIDMHKSNVVAGDEYLVCLACSVEELLLDLATVLDILQTIREIVYIVVHMI